MNHKQPATFNDILDFAIAPPIAIAFTIFVGAICLAIDFEQYRKKRKTRSHK